MEQQSFQPGCLPLLIGSLPLLDHQEATDLILEYTPQIPLWPQLPAYAQEGMLSQFLPGLPGYVQKGDKEYLDTGSESFETELLEFYETYMGIVEEKLDLDRSLFSLDRGRACGFFQLMDTLAGRETSPMAVKGQITGPITFGTGVKDQDGKAIFYDEQLRDAAVKLLALKAAWQVEQLSPLRVPVLLFFDEPALAGFGSSEFISISRQNVLDCLNEVIEQVHVRNGLAGVHICANADWSVLLESKTDILSFDAYAYFEKLAMFEQGLKAFMERGGIIAWGIVPTQDPESIEGETPESLSEKLQAQFRQLEKMGVEPKQLFEQSLITPSCGTGSLSLEHAKRVLFLTREVSKKMRRI
ncbi:MAG: hypothetical protein K9K64_12710 [Desulfohalobiaceae bacterium]|nr:hypothetical protein [Desulfohalobiaceae bacterium]